MLLLLVLLVLETFPIDVLGIGLLLVLWLSGYVTGEEAITVAAANNLGIDPRALIFTICFAASASFSLGKKTELTRRNT